MKFSALFQRLGGKAVLVFGGGGVLLAVFFFASLTQGQLELDVRTVIEALIDPQHTPEHDTVRGLRLPRAVMGVLAGASLAVAGVLLQTVTRNPLASAGTLGINAGAYFAIVVSTIFFPVWAAKAALPLAFAGAAGAAAIAFLLAGGRKATPVRTALSGMIVTLLLSSFTGALQLLYENETSGLFMWGAGYLQQNDWDGVRYSLPWIAAGLCIVLLSGRKLDLLELSEETSRSLGQRVDAARLAALGLAVLLASVTVSVVGPIGFVGLIAPHLVRLLGFRRHRSLLPASAIWGAAVLVGADTVARLFYSSLGELPAGAVTAALGAPWLIWLVARGAKETRAAEAAASMRIGFAPNSIPYPLMVAVTALACASVFAAGLAAGSLTLPLGDVLATLAGGGSDLSRNIVFTMRLPRMLVAALAGALLAAAGTMLQTAVRNPLADPSVIGVTSGAGFGALLMLVVWPQSPAYLLPLAAIAGAAAAVGIVYALAWRNGLSPAALALVGIAVSAIGSAGIQFLVIKAKITVAPALAWLAGSTYARGWREFAILAVASAILLPLSWMLGRRADLLAFGDHTSLGLGLKLRQTRLIAVALGAGMAAMAVAAVGTVGFIGLLAPHAVRWLVGQNHRRSIVLSSLVGALLLVGADLIGRVALAPKEIPSGLVVALLGTPYLLAVMYRSAGRK